MGKVFIWDLLVRCFIVRSFFLAPAISDLVLEFAYLLLLWSCSLEPLSCISTWPPSWNRRSIFLVARSVQFIFLIYFHKLSCLYSSRVRETATTGLTLKAVTEQKFYRTLKCCLAEVQKCSFPRTMRPSVFLKPGSWSCFRASLDNPDRLL